MKMYLVVLSMLMGLSFYAFADEQYYLSNPKELQQAVKACPAQTPKDLSCQQAEELAVHMNKLAYQLQGDPQGFGGIILKLQETLANQQVELKTAGSNDALKATIEKNKQVLAEHLAIVKWLESPES
ncbi:MAG: hypothetical protein ACHP6H_06895 [Legionellales bacterium]